MKKNTSQYKIAPRTALIFLLMVAFSAVAFRIFQQTDFTGTWKISPERSDFHGAPEFTASKTMIVSRDTAGLIIDRTSISTSGADSASVEKLRSDGTPTMLSTGEGQTRKLNALWSDDGKTLTELVHGYSKSGSQSFSAAERWQLAADNKTLMITKKVNVSSGFTYTVDLVYEKQ